jgi:Ni,Fe-hydrogenase III large subunit/Ni,Fe-hydrogenase III component G
MISTLDYFETRNFGSFSTSELSDGSFVIDAKNQTFKQVIKELMQKQFEYLSTIIGYQNNEDIILLYPLSSVTDNSKVKTVFVKTSIPLSNPKIESIEDYFPVANVYEREISDLLGVDYLNIEKRDKLLLPESFPKDIYPLRKGITGRELREKLDQLNIGMEASEPLQIKSDYTMSIGPQHPTHKEPIRFQFFVEGEEIKDVKLRLGFNHRGIEKALEGGEWVPNLYLIERICGICSAAHQLAYTITTEKIAKISDEVPDRAQWIRVLISELERIHSHILWYGVLAHDGGYDLMFHVTWRDRELVMDILEDITGNRVNYSIETIGGVRRDLSPEIIERTRRKIVQLRSKIENHYEILQKEKTFIDRVEGIGYLPYNEAIKFSVCGPTARGSNVNIDLRRDYPYAAYKDIPFNVYTRSEGDVLASMMVRLDETLESANMCLYILDNLPSGSISIPIPKRIPEGEAHTRVEAPRGEDIHFIKSNAGKTPDRYKIRAPTLANIVSLLDRFKLMKIADIPMIIRLIDPCIGCMERVTFVDLKTSKSRDITGRELIARSNKSFRSRQPFRVYDLMR